MKDFNLYLFVVVIAYLIRLELYFGFMQQSDIKLICEGISILSFALCFRAHSAR